MTGSITELVMMPAILQPDTYVNSFAQGSSDAWMNFIDEGKSGSLLTLHALRHWRL